MKRGKARKLIKQAINAAIAKGQYDGQTWRTINGTDVQIGDDGQIINGPAGLKEWAANGGTKGGGKSSSGGGHKVVNGSDISGSYKGDTDIKSVLKAQGYDGLPKVVSGDEFEEAVKDSNFIAQRTYSASSEEILKEYQDMLYDGEFYVDCTVGGSQYGQGMYCAADYNGELTEGITEEMQHYQELGASRNRMEAKYDYINTLTADDLNSSWYLRNEQLTDDEARVFLNIKGSDKVLSDLSPEDRAIVDEMQKKEHGSSKWMSAQTALDSDFVRPWLESYTGHSVVETLTLDPSAKIISYRDLQEMKGNEQINYISTKMHEYVSNSSDPENLATYMDYRWGDRSKYNSEEKSKILDWEEANYKVADAALTYHYQCQNESIDYARKFRQMDDGAYAALKGYDAINANDHGQSGSYTVVLNRTKMILQDNRIVTKAEGQVRMSEMKFEPDKDGYMKAIRDGKVIGWVYTFGTQDQEKKTKKGGVKKMKKKEAQRLIDQAVEKAMGTPVKKDWVTINGTHVFVGDDGDVEYGPANLRGSGSSSGGKSSGSKSSGNSNGNTNSKSGNGKSSSSSASSSSSSGSSNSSSEKKDPFKNSYEVKGRVNDTLEYLRNTKEKDLYGRSTYFPGGWDDVQLDASITGFKVYREQNPTYAAQHKFSECYHFIKDPNSKRG